MTFEYSKQVMKEFLEPKNFGEMENPDAVGETGSPACGDIMKLYLKVKDNKIEDIMFQTFGCASAIATTSIITQIVKGMPIDEAENLTMQDVMKKLEGLPQIKVHCSSMGIQALKKAIENYRSKN